MSRHLAGHITSLLLLLLGSGALQHLHLQQAHQSGSAAREASNAVCHGGCATRSCQPADPPAAPQRQDQRGDRPQCPTCQLLATLSAVPAFIAPPLLVGEQHVTAVRLFPQTRHPIHSPRSIASRAPPLS
jgi:hypothetical protein